MMSKTKATEAIDHAQELLNEVNEMEIRKTKNGTILLPAGWVGKDIRRSPSAAGGTPGWQIFDHNSGFEKYARQQGTYVAATLEKAIARVRLWERGGEEDIEREQEEDW